MSHNQNTWIFCRRILCILSCFLWIQPLTVNGQTDENVSRVTIRSIGDILIHNEVYYDAANESGYNFDHMLEPVKPYLENADITTANLEVLVAGEEFGLSSYPTFNAPSEIIDALQNVGVDLVNNATNHTLDFGAEGAHASIDALQARDMMYVGSYDSWDDYNNQRIIEANGISVGFLSYANDANGNYIPEDEPYLLSLINPELIPLEIELMNSQADVSVVMFHMGEENEFYPNDYQFEIFQLARDAGANFILGGHPHVMQPFIYFSPSQGGIFSHGNFLSGQYELQQKLGGIVEYTFTKNNDTAEVLLESMRFMPTYNYGMPESEEYAVVPLVEADDYGLGNADELFTELEARMTYYTNHVEVVDYLD